VADQHATGCPAAHELYNKHEVRLFGHLKAA